MTLSREPWISRPSVTCPVYWIKPSLRNRFMKKLTLERVVPTISASVSWLILAITGSGSREQMVQ
jgi:hypothetical protein